MRGINAIWYPVISIFDYWNFYVEPTRIKCIFVPSLEHIYYAKFANFIAEDSDSGEEKPKQKKRKAAAAKDEKPKKKSKVEKEEGTNTPLL